MNNIVLYSKNMPLYLGRKLEYYYKNSIKCANKYKDYRL